LLGRIGGIFQEKVVLSPLEVADSVREIILSENTNFRFQPSKELYSEEIAARFADPTGYKSGDLISQKFCLE